jgi:hypothetical protein
MPCWRMLFESTASPLYAFAAYLHVDETHHMWMCADTFLIRLETEAPKAHLIGCESIFECEAKRQNTEIITSIEP